MAALFAASLFSTPAFAQVTEINSDGSAVTYAGPVVTTAEGSRPLRNPAPARRETSGSAIVESSLRDAASRHNLAAQLVEAVAWQESRLHPDALSPRGARGVMQLMPGTARELHVDAADLRQNTDGGAAYLAGLMTRFKGDLVLALAAYNAGADAVLRHGGVPPFAETKAYVNAVLERMASYADRETRP